MADWIVAEPPCGYGRATTLDGQSKVAIGFTTYVLGEGEVVFAKAGEFGLEGVMSKRAGSFYRSEKSRSWRAR